MARITHPRPQMGRQTFAQTGIEFRDGIADVDDLHPNYREALIQHGFTIDDTPELEVKTVEELRAELEGFGYDVKKSWKKPELIERIAQHIDLNTEKFSPGDGVEKFAIVEQEDGTVVGDGQSLATLPIDSTGDEA